MKKTLLFFALLLIPVTSFAAFSDVSPAHENYTAINYLELNGIIEGYEDGTFKPDQLVTRAEAVKIIFEPLFETFDEVTEKPFPDVETDLWFSKYVLQGKLDGVISGDGETGNFVAGRNVNKVEFLKIILLAYKVDLVDFQTSDITPFSDLVDHNNLWFFPYAYYSAETNLVNGDINNNLNAGAALTRAEVAEISYRLIRNIQGGDIQLNLSMSESKMIQVLQYLQTNDIEMAKYASDKSIQYADNALALSPEESIVQAANKIAYSFEHLIKAYESGLNEDYAGVETHTGDAWALADEALSIDTAVEALANNIKEIAHSMAESARISTE